MEKTQRAASSLVCPLWASVHTGQGPECSAHDLERGKVPGECGQGIRSGGWFTDSATGCTLIPTPTFPSLF